MPPKKVWTKFGRKVVRRSKRKQMVYRSKMNSRSNDVHYFKRTYMYKDILASDQDQFFGEKFTLAQFPHTDEIRDLFDQYKLCAIKFRIYPVYNSIDIQAVGASTQTINAPISSVIDYTDSTAPNNEGELLEYNTLKMTRGWKEHTRYFKPRASVYMKEVTNAAARPVRTWLSTEFPDVEHYGLKFFVPKTGDMQDQDCILYRIYVTMYIACKNVK